MQHMKVVDEWIAESIKDVAPELQVEIFKNAINSLQQRTVVTLSSVTWNAILDRVLAKTQQKFPQLSEFKIETGRILVDLKAYDCKNQNPEHTAEAFQFFLIELLTIMDNLTSGILTEPLFGVLTQLMGVNHAESRKGGTHASETIRRTH